MVKLRDPRRVAWVLVLAGACGGDAGSGEGTSGESSSSEPVGTDTTGDDVQPPSPGTCASFSTTGMTALVLTSNGKPGGPTCSADPAPCGGDPIGVWTLQASCGGETSVANPFASACPGAQFMPSAPAHRGLVTVDGAAHLELALTSTYDFTVRSDAACFGGWECGPQLVPELVAFFGGTASCAGDPDSCTCDVDGATIDGLHISGDASHDGRSVLVGADDLGLPRTMPYCVTDGVMQLWLPQQSPVLGDMPCNAASDCVAEEGRVALCL